MWFLLGLAVRNLQRNVRRTVITSIAVVAGVAMMILGWGLVDGLDENFLRAARTTYAGEVILRPTGFPDDGVRFPLDESEAIPDGLRAELDKAGVWTARAAFPARLVKGSEADRVVVWAYDESTETKVFPRKGWSIEGSWPEAGKPQLVAGWAFARLMDIEPGDELVVEARTRDGALNALPFTLTGIVRSDNAGLDNSGVWMEMSTADSLALLNGYRTHIAVMPTDGSRRAEALAASLSRDGWHAMSLAAECDDMIAINRIRRRAISLVVVMIMAIAATGIANTVIMAAFERVREIGTLIALGMPRAHVRALFLLEGAVMGLVAGALGATIGGLLVHYWQVNGFSVGDAVVEASGSMAVSQYVYTQFGWPPLLLSLAFGVAVALGASIWPAHNASKIIPADAVRAD
jgi:putative ABC transport system permease protein